MTKNIAVIDEQGNRYEATYPRRAKGLVKNGRARFVDEHTICLACPPYKSEDEKMSELNLESENLNAEELRSENLNKAEKIQESAAACLDSLRQASGKGEGKGFKQEILERLLNQLDHFPPDNEYIKDLAANGVDADHMLTMITTREETRQLQLEVYRAILEKVFEN